MRFGLICLALSLVLGACKTRLFVEDISANPTERRVDGIPFKVRETHTLRVFQYQAPPKDSGKDGKFDEVFVTHRPLPNPHRIFVLNFRAQAFTAHTFKTEFLPDSTLKSVAFKGTPSPEGAKQLADDLVDVAGKVQSLEDDIKAKEKERADAKLTEGLATFDDIRKYEETFRSLHTLCASRPELVSKVDAAKAAWDAHALASPNDTEGIKTMEEAYDSARAALATAEASIRSAMWDLNRLAHKLNRSPPFPDPNPSQLVLDQLCEQIAGLYTVK